VTTELRGPDGDILGSPPRITTWHRYFPGGEEPPPPPPPPTVANRPWIGSSAPEGLTGFNRLQTQIVGRDLELRTVFSSSFVVDPTSLLMPDITAGRVPSYSLKPPSTEAQWDDFAENIEALPGFVIATVNHEPENDAGYSAAQFEDDFSAMYTRCSSVANLWMGPVYMAVTASSPTRQEYRDLLDTMDFDLIQVDGYNQLYKRSFSQIFNWFALKARTRTDLNTDPLIAGVPWAVRETSVHGTDVQRANWVNSARGYWENPVNRDLVAVNWFDSEVGDNAAIVGWRMERALPIGWYAQPIPPSTKPVARAAPPHDPEWVEDFLTPAAVRNALATPRRPLGPVIPPPVPPPEPPLYGALALGETNYLIPTSNVKFCSPAGNDTATGTEENPYKTLQKAIDECPQDGTVVMRGGEYPEQVNGKWQTRMTIQAYPGEAPILIGSNVTTGWLQDDTGPGGTPRWRKNNWTTEFDETPADPVIIDPAFPESVKPYQVWIDDVALQQVNSLAEVDASAPNEAGAPGTFWQDTAANVLWIGSTPFNKTVRVAVRQRAFVASSGGAQGDPRVDLKGIGVFHYATSSKQYGALIINAPDTIVEHCHVIGNSARGIFLNVAEGCKIRQNTIERNGMMGGGSFKSPYLELHNNRIYKNNRKYFETGQAAGGWKHDTDGVGFNCHHNQVHANTGHGLWSDLGSHYTSFWRNDVRDNTSSGIFFELSIVGRIYGNYFRGQSIALLNASSSIVDVWNNTFVDNTRHWWVRHDDRPETQLPVERQFTQGTYRGGNNVFCNYIADNNARLVSEDDPHGGTMDIDEKDWQINYSAAYRLTAGTSKYADVLLSTGQTTYATQDDLQSATGREVNGIWQDGGADPYLQGDKSTPIVLGPLIESGEPAPDYVGLNLEWTVEQIATPNRGWL
jgi:parallel beta-helix repeat protein